MVDMGAGAILVLLGLRTCIGYGPSALARTGR